MLEQATIERLNNGSSVPFKDVNKNPFKAVAQAIRLTKQQWHTNGGTLRNGTRNPSGVRHNKGEYCYSTDPMKHCKKSDYNDAINGQYLGIEWEVGYKQHIRSEFAVKELNNWLNNYAIAKSDSSVRYGHEICTAPLFLESVKKVFSYNRVAHVFKEYLRKDDVESCGLHVHLNKFYFNSEQLVAMNSFFYESGNEDFLAFIAGRKPNDYCESCSYSTTNRLDAVKRGVTNTGIDEKYSTLYEHRNNVTMEIRMFASPTTHRDLLSRIEFAHSMYGYFGDEDNKSPHVQNYLAWLSKTAQRRKYPALTRAILGRYRKVRPLGEVCVKRKLISDASPKANATKEAYRDVSMFFFMEKQEHKAEVKKEKMLIKNLAKTIANYDKTVANILATGGDIPYRIAHVIKGDCISAPPPMEACVQSVTIPDGNFIQGVSMSDCVQSPTNLINTGEQEACA